MVHLKNISNWIIKRTPLLCGLLFAAVLALLPIPAGAQCANWDAAGGWNIRQRGAADLIQLRLEQRGRVLTGTAYNDAVTGWYEVRRVEGTVDGTIDGDRLSVQIFWSGQLTGVYDGKVPIIHTRRSGSRWTAGTKPSLSNKRKVRAR